MIENDYHVVYLLGMESARSMSISIELPIWRTRRSQHNTFLKLLKSNRNCMPRLSNKHDWGFDS